MGSGYVKRYFIILKSFSRYFEKSITMYKNALEKKPNDGELNVLLGMSYLDYGQADIGKQEIRKGLKLAPSLLNKYPEINAIIDE